MASHRANHVLHVRSAARAQEAQCSHRTVSWPAGPQERREVAFPQIPDTLAVTPNSGPRLCECGCELPGGSHALSIFSRYSNSTL
jgi:hypothetical protein